MDTTGLTLSVRSDPSGMVPPQMPSCLVCGSMDSHAGGTCSVGRPLFAAFYLWCRAGPFVAIGQKSAGSSRWQASLALSIRRRPRPLRNAVTVSSTRSRVPDASRVPHASRVPRPCPGPLHGHAGQLRRVAGHPHAEGAAPLEMEGRPPVAARWRAVARAPAAPARDAGMGWWPGVAGSTVSRPAGSRSRLWRSAAAGRLSGLAPQIDRASPGRSVMDPDADGLPGLSFPSRAEGRPYHRRAQRRTRRRIRSCLRASPCPRPPAARRRPVPEEAR